MNKNWLMSLLVIVFIYQLGFFAVHLPSFLHYLYWGSASIFGLVIGFYSLKNFYKKLPVAVLGTLTFLIGGFTSSLLLLELATLNM